MNDTQCADQEGAVTTQEDVGSVNVTPSLSTPDGVNANKGLKKRQAKTLSTLGRARVVAALISKPANRLVALEVIRGNASSLSSKDKQDILEIESFIRTLVTGYLKTESLPDWAKQLPSNIKNFFRLLEILQQPDGQAFTIRLSRDVAEAALAAPRGPADFLSAIIKRQLEKLGIKTEIVFNLEFVHGRSNENHPLHLHGAFRIPDSSVSVATDALKAALALRYRARGRNLPILIERPRSASGWAAYAAKELDVTMAKLKTLNPGRLIASYSTHAQSRRAKEYYETIQNWLTAGGDELP
ncbi:MAG: hypothetical protein ABWZ65_15145 [Pseudomonas mandelii]